MAWSHLRAAARFVSLLAVLFACGVMATFAVVRRRFDADGARKFGARWCRRWCGLSCRLAGIRVEADPVPSGSSFLIASNHLSYADIWVLGSLWECGFVAKREIRDWPIVGWVADAAGTLFVDRKLVRDLPRTARGMEKHLASDLPLVLFPEGGAGRGDAIRPFRAALFEPAVRAGLPCYATALAYETPGDPRSPGETVSWSDGRHLLLHAWNLLRLPRIVARVRIDPVPRRAEDRKRLAAELETAVREMFVPLSPAASVAN